MFVSGLRCSLSLFFKLGLELDNSLMIALNSASVNSLFCTALLSASLSHALICSLNSDKASVLSLPLLFLVASAQEASEELAEALRFVPLETPDW